MYFLLDAKTQLNQSSHFFTFYDLSVNVHLSTINYAVSF